jgi:ABC-type nitrate/sulfonate/bicarbonate transport system substrate-binding protein
MLSGCAGKSAPTQGQKEIINVKTSTITGVSWAPLFVASSEGFFQKEGLNIEYVTPGGPKGFQAMHAGSCDFSMLSQEPLLIAQEKGMRSTLRNTYSPDCRITESGENAVVNMCISSGLISKPIPYKEIVNMTFVDNYKK